MRMEDSRYELLTAISGLLESGLSSDLLVRCGDSEFKAHKAIVGARSRVLGKACDGDQWREGKEGVLVIGDSLTGTDPSDDPVAVDMLLQFIYRGDYEPGSDPYWKVRKRGSVDAIVTGVDPNNGFSRPETSSGLALNEIPQSLGMTGDSDVLSSMNSGLLNLHAKMYALGDKYELPSLQTCALGKFKSDAARLAWHSEAFCAAMDTTFSSTVFQDADLRDSVIEIVHVKVQAGLVCHILDEYIRNMPEVAYMLWKRGCRKSPSPDLWLPPDQRKKKYSRRNQE